MITSWYIQSNFLVTLTKTDLKILFILIITVAGQYSVYGQSISSFTLPNVSSGTEFSLTSFSNEKAIVLVFYSGKCAYGEYYLDRIKSLLNEYSSKSIKFVFINSNDNAFVHEESNARMKEFVSLNNLNIPYLADKDKVVKNLLYATRTPEAFILTPEKDKFRIVYQGAIDDSPQLASDVGHAYLRDNIILLLNNNKILVNQTRPIGCLIK